MGYRERKAKLNETYPKRREWWSRVFATPVARTLLLVCADWPALTPNRLTFSSLILTLFSAVLILQGEFGFLVAAGLLLQLAYVLDCMDGQLARYRQTVSKSGAFYDLWSDFVKFPVLLLALSMVAWQRSPSVLPLLLGTGSIFLVTYLPYLKLLEDRDFEIKGWEPFTGSGFASRNMRFFLFEESQWYLMVGACLILNEPLLALVLMAGTQSLVATGRSWRVFRWIAKNG